MGKRYALQMTPMTESAHPELDDNPFLDAPDHAKFRSLVGCTNQLITLGHFDITYTTTPFVSLACNHARDISMLWCTSSDISRSYRSLIPAILIIATLRLRSMVNGVSSMQMQRKKSLIPEICQHHKAHKSTSLCTRIQTMHMTCSPADLFQVSYSS